MPKEVIVLPIKKKEYNPFDKALFRRRRPEMKDAWT
jgi:hypothetical protein